MWGLWKVCGKWTGANGETHIFVLPRATYVHAEFNASLLSAFPLMFMRAEPPDFAIPYEDAVNVCAFVLEP